MAKYKPIQLPYRKGKTINGDSYEIYEEFGYYTLYIRNKMCATRPKLQQIDDFLNKIKEK